jgi:hypothetical protein
MSGLFKINQCAIGQAIFTFLFTDLVSDLVRVPKDHRERFALLGSFRVRIILRQAAAFLTIPISHLDIHFHGDLLEYERN